MSRPGTEDCNILKSLHHLKGVSGKSAFDYTNFIDTSFLTPMENFKPLTCNPLQQQTVTGDFTDEITLITEMSTFKKLAVLNPTKAHGPDAILRWLLKKMPIFWLVQYVIFSITSTAKGGYLQYGRKPISSQFQSNN